jgi:predicted transcriptional regulator
MMTKKPTLVSLGLKVTPEIKQKLDEAARASGRTQSQEAELRLERTFEPKVKSA